MANTNVKLLLVDDNPMVLGMLRGALTPLANVITSNDSADALLKAVDDPPDLLISDYRMPGMDGRSWLKSCAAVRAPPESPLFWSPAKPILRRSSRTATRSMTSSKSLSF